MYILFAVTDSLIFSYIYSTVFF